MILNPFTVHAYTHTHTHAHAHAHTHILILTDDTRELSVVKRALQEHIEIDPALALQVLCDQCRFDPSSLPSDEDKIWRQRLRGLVIRFLAEKYSVCIAGVVQDVEVEKILVKGLVEVCIRSAMAGY